VLEYSGGSPCPDLDDLDKRDLPDGEPKLFAHHVYEDPARALAARREKEPKRRKTATFEFRCDRDGPEAAVTFVHTPDECAYFFRVRSMHACAGVEPHKPGSVGPGGVFAIIFFVALLVYFLGGVFYQRTVAHARGWRQLPNYSLWASIWTFLKVRMGLCPGRWLAPPRLTRLACQTGHLHHPHLVVRAILPPPQRVPHAFRLAEDEGP